MSRLRVNRQTGASRSTTSIVGFTHTLSVFHVVLRMIKLPVTEKLAEQWQTVFTSMANLGNQFLDTAHTAGGYPQPIQSDSEERKECEVVMKQCLHVILKHDLSVFSGHPDPQRWRFMSRSKLQRAYNKWSVPTEGKHAVIPDDFVRMLAKITQQYGLDMSYSPVGKFFDRDLLKDVPFLECPRYQMLCRLEELEANEKAPAHIRDGDSSGQVVDAVKTDADVRVDDDNTGPENKEDGNGRESRDRGANADIDEGEKV